MKHGDLLDKIYWHWNHSKDKIHWGMNDYRKALLRVAELHKPEPNYWEEDDLVCRECGNPDTQVIYPCPTIQAIEKELT